MRRHIAFAISILFVSAATAASDALHVPPELAPWREWVLHYERAASCPIYSNATGVAPHERACALGGPLAVQVDAQGARFSQSLRVFGRTTVHLPGDASQWPQGVTLNGRPAKVIARGDSPGIELEPGTYALAGRFSWQRRPETLEIPDWIGLIELTLDGRAVPRPERNDEGLWLGRRASAGAAEEKDAIELQVYRRVEDGVPVIVTTQLQFAVSGRAREESFPHALLAGFVPLNVASELPGRFDAEGRLVLQVRPGNWDVTVRARARTPAVEFTVPIATGI